MVAKQLCALCCCAFHRTVVSGVCSCGNEGDLGVCFHTSPLRKVKEAVEMRRCGDGTRCCCDTLHTCPPKPKPTREHYILVKRDDPRRVLHKYYSAKCLDCSQVHTYTYDFVTPTASEEWGVKHLEASSRCKLVTVNVSTDESFSKVIK